MSDAPTVYSERFLYGYRDRLLPHVDAVGVPASYLTTPGAEISVDKYAALLHLAAEKVDPLIGFEIGKSLKYSDIGVLGYAAAACRDVEGMLRILEKYIYVFCHLNRFHLDLGQAFSAFSYSFPVAEVAHRRHDEEMAIVSIVNFIRQCTGRPFVPEYVEFAHPRPDAPIERYTDHFGCDVYFNRGRNAFCFRNEVLACPLVTADPRHLDALDFYLADQLKHREGGGELVARLRHLITVSLSNGEVHVCDIARQLGMSARTMQRHLRDCDTSFSELVEGCRRTLAIDYVKSTDYSLTEVALMLGYGELSSFSRAYKRWTGKSPRETRSY